jgi:hypothetical protein
VSPKIRFSTVMFGWAAWNSLIRRGKISCCWEYQVHIRTVALPSELPPDPPPQAASNEAAPSPAMPVPAARRTARRESGAADASSKTGLMDAS